MFLLLERWPLPLPLLPLWGPLSGFGLRAEGVTLNRDFLGPLIYIYIYMYYFYTSSIAPGIGK